MLVNIGRELNFNKLARLRMIFDGFSNLSNGHERNVNRAF